MYYIKKSYFLTAIAGLAWVGMVAFGLGAMLTHESTPGAIGAAPASWPTGTAIERATEMPTLVMVAHPRCPCTAASLNELAQIMASAPGKISARVLFLKPSDSGSDWDETSLWQSAVAIPGVKPIADVDGLEAERFGAKTSGHTFLFAADGRLLFSGGITGSRGHAGDNVGESAIVALLKNGQARETRTRVFGCSLSGPKPAEGPKALCLN